MESEVVKTNNCRFEILHDGGSFIGVGKIWISDILVRSGRLPIRPYTQSFTGVASTRLEWIGIERSPDEVRVKARMIFEPLDVKLLRDHSIDPIHDTHDWDKPGVAGSAELDLVFRPATDVFNGVKFEGFSYHYEYRSQDVPIFYLMDRASWELEGDINGASIYSQSACSSPAVDISDDTFFTTEGELFFLDQASHYNRTMTHNLPRWTDHQAFDYQHKADGKTLIGVFDRVDLIRTVLRRDKGSAELKTFDKHVFDESLSYCTSSKKILLNIRPKTKVAQQNLWTWIFDETSRRARAEFGLKEQLPIMVLQHHYWTNCTIDTYYKDVVPACAALGIKAIFTENFKKSEASEIVHLPNGNMCGSHEYEMADSKGGTKKFKEYIDRCHSYGIKNFMWTNTYVSLAAKINCEHRVEGGKSWFMAMEDTRTKFAGAYTCVSSNINFKNPDARRYWIDAHKKIVDETGLDGFFVDSHYNLFFMPVDYQTGHPRTVWRESLAVMKELQDHGVEWSVESFGPFGLSIHGHSDAYDLSRIFICYRVGLGNNYVTVPIPGVETTRNISHEPGFLFYTLAHQAQAILPVFIDGKRIDEVYGEEHRRILKAYDELLPQMCTRYLQEDGQSVLWHDDARQRATLWNFSDRSVQLPGKVRDLAAGAELPARAKAERYALKARHIYQIEGAELPVMISMASQHQNDCA
ncbi:MAG TPA: glycoside hydrolase family 66 protein [Tepidisphaeraceae bacterium]|jgi:hypothetical protein